MTYEESVMSALHAQSLTTSDALWLLESLEQALYTRIAESIQLRNRITAQPELTKARRYAENNNGAYELAPDVRTARCLSRQCLVCCNRVERRSLLCNECKDEWRSCSYCQRIYLLVAGRFLKRHGVYDYVCGLCRGVQGHMTHEERHKRMLRLIALRKRNVPVKQCAEALGFASAQSASAALCIFLRKHPEYRWK